MVSAAGWRVERIPETNDAGTSQGLSFRVSWHGYWQADCATSAEVAKHVDLATLVPDIWSHVRPSAMQGLAAPKTRR